MLQSKPEQDSGGHCGGGGPGGWGGRGEDHLGEDRLGGDHLGTVVVSGGDHLSMVAARARAIYNRQARERMQARKGDQPGASQANLPDMGQARDAAGKAVGVSGKSVDHATKVLTKCAGGGRRRRAQGRPGRAGRPPPHRPGAPGRRTAQQGLHGAVFWPGAGLAHTREVVIYVRGRAENAAISADCGHTPARHVDGKDSLRGHGLRPYGLPERHGLQQNRHPPTTGSGSEPARAYLHLETGAGGRLGGIVAGGGWGPSVFITGG